MYRIGPAKLLISPTGITADVGTWIDLGDTRGDVVVTPSVGTATGRVDQSGPAARADSAYRTGVQVAVTAPLLDRTLQTLAALVPGAIRVTAPAEALGLGSGFGRVTPVACAVVPLSEYDAAGDWYWHSQFTVWVPRACLTVLGEIRHALPEGDDALEGGVYEVTIASYAGDASIPRSARDAGGIGTVQVDLLGRTAP